MFVARDVAVALGYAQNNLSTVLQRFCRGITKCDIPTSSGRQSMTIIPERDLYRLVLNSKLPSAEAFHS